MDQLVTSPLVSEALNSDPLGEFLDEVAEHDGVETAVRIAERAAAAAALMRPAPLGRVALPGDKGRVRFVFWYEALIDWMLAHPGGSMREAAVALDRGERTLTTVLNSDVFKRRYAERRAEHSALLSASLIDVQEALALDALKIVRERVANNPDRISTGQMHEIANDTLARLGYGVAAGGGNAAAANNTTVIVGADLINAARDAARGAQLRTIEAKASEASPRRDADPRSGALLPVEARHAS